MQPSPHVQDDHYSLLGLDVSASSSDIRLALEGVCREADALAFSAPDESRAQWALIRQVQHDLLSGRRRREAYDLFLLGQLTATATSQPARMPAVPASAVPAVSTPFEYDDDIRSDPVMRWAPIVGAAAVLIALVLALIPRGTATHPATGSSALILTDSGAHQGSAFASGHSVRLSWSRVDGARLYHLQVAAQATDPSDAVVFRHPLQTIATQRTTYQLKVVGAQLYYWRVQTLVGERWAPYTHSHQFKVARPIVSAPVALAGDNHSVRAGQPARLCWSEVRGAVGYRLRLSGASPVMERATCASLTLHPGRYHWTVAALVQGRQTYAGASSRPASLDVNTPQTVKPLATPTSIATVAQVVQPVHLSRMKRTSRVRGTSRPAVRTIAAVAPARQTRLRVARHVSGLRLTARTQRRHTSRRTVKRHGNKIGLASRARHLARSVVHSKSVAHKVHARRARRQPARARTVKRAAPSVPPSPASVAPAKAASPASAAPGGATLPLPAPTQAAEPVAIAQATPAGQSTASVNIWAPAHSQGTSSGAGGPSNQSHPGQPAAAAPTAPSAAAATSLPAAVSPPVAAAPPTSASPASGRNGGQRDQGSQGSHHDQGDQGDHGDRGHHDHP